MMGGIAVTRSFAEEHPQALAAFLQEYAASVEFTIANPESAAQLIEHYDIMNAAVAERAIPNAHIVCIRGAEMKAGLQQFFDILYGSDPASLGGAIPGDDFYIME